MEVVYLYFFFTGCVFASWMWDEKDPIWLKVLVILFGFIYGWFVMPILIGRTIKQFYKD